MKKIAFLAFLLAYCTAVTASQLVLHIQGKGSYSIEINETVRIDELCQWFLGQVKEETDSITVITEQGRQLSAQEYLQPQNYQEVWVDQKEDPELLPKKTYIGYRSYENKTTQSEKDDMYFIMKSLATKSIPWLMKNKSKLSAAGNRIDSVHPLRFLETVFTEEELKVYLHNIRKRSGFTWSEYLNGIKGSLEDECLIGNLTNEMLLDFASNVNVDYSILEPLARQEKWEDLIKTLIVYVPREGDSGRYDQ